MTLTPLTGWLDYDRPRLANLSSRQRVLYFRKRLSIVLLPALGDLYRGIRPGPQPSPLLVFATAVCCSMEAFGKFKNGGSGHNCTRFNAFVDAYMHSDYSTRTVGGKTYKEILWKHYRNGLAHGFAVSHGGFEVFPGYFQVRRIAGHDALMINPEHFYRDFRSGVAKYLRELKSAGPSDPIRLNFDKVFKAVFIDGH